MSLVLDTRPLRTSPTFRRLWVSSSLSAVGSQFTLVAVLYQAWSLTRSPAVVGAVGLAQAAPMAVFGLVGGSLADTVDRRRLVLLATSGQLLAASLLALQAVAELRSVAVLLALYEAGLKVPEDLAVVGYDDIEFAASAVVPLTSVRRPAARLPRACYPPSRSRPASH